MLKGQFTEEKSRKTKTWNDNQHLRVIRILSDMTD